MMSPLYNRDVLRLAASIPHVGRLSRPDATVTKRSAVCGSTITIDVMVDGQGQVSNIGLEIRACALGQASASLMAAQATGKSAGELDEAHETLRAFLAGGRQDPGEWPGLSALSGARDYPARHAAILLPFDAVREAAAKARQSAAAVVEMFARQGCR